MTSISVTEARKRLFALIDEVGESHAPIEIRGKRGNAVLVSEDDWRDSRNPLSDGNSRDAGVDCRRHGITDERYE